MSPHHLPSRSAPLTSWARVCALAAALTAPSLHAYADDAATHAKRAQIAYDLQDWPAAVIEFQLAYQLDQKSEYLWGLAQAQRLSGDCASAILSYKAYKRSEGISGTQSTASELQIMKCEAEIAKKDAESGKAAATASSSAPSASVATPTAHALPPPPNAPKSAAKIEPKPFYADVLGDVLFVGGVAAAGVGTYLLFKGNSDMHAAQNAPTYGVYDAEVNDATRMQRIGVVTLGAGGVLVGMAIVRFLTLGPPQQGDASTGLVVGPTVAGWNVGWMGRF